MSEYDRRTRLQQAFARTLAGRYDAALNEITRLNAEIAALHARRTYSPVRHPGRDVAVLACACGRVLNARDMVRIVVPHGGPGVDSAPGIARIGCGKCATAAAGARRRRPNPSSWSA